MPGVAGVIWVLLVATGRAEMRRTGRKSDYNEISSVIEGRRTAQIFNDMGNPFNQCSLVHPLWRCLRGEVLYFGFSF
jgi:hypothetical protein